MLDVGFSEILLTSAIALIVLGPERLPKVARQVGNWMGRARAMARQLTEQLEREVDAEALLKPSKTASKPSAAIQQHTAPETAKTSSIESPPEPAAHASFSTTAVPATDVPAIAAPMTAPAPMAEAPAYTSEAPHGADWHPAPPENKPQ